MEARASFRGTGVSKSVSAVAAVLVAAGLAVMAGYLAKGFGSTAAPSSQHVQAAPGTVLRQDGLSQALAPNQAVVPGWIVQEIAPKTAPQLLQDDIIRYARPAELPGWLVQEIGPTTAPRILQDDPNFITLPKATPARAMGHGYF